MSKICSICHRSLSLDNFGSYFDRRGEVPKLRIRSWCKKCYADKYSQNKTHHQALSRKSYQRNREQRLALARQWQKNNPDRRRDIDLKHQYGINQTTYEKYYMIKEGAAAFAGTNPVSAVSQWITAMRLKKLGAYFATNAILCSA